MFITKYIYFADYNTTSDGWTEWRGNQYTVNRMMMPIEDARHYCQQRGGDLVSISSRDENIFLWKQVFFVITFQFDTL